MKTVFYSWQSDVFKNTNRFFIEECIKQAISELKNDCEIIDREDFNFDKDTKGVSGSPDIVKTIFDKIVIFLLLMYLL